MEINQLRYLIALNKTRNFSRAAEMSFVTQPTLSQQIKKLEMELGVQLFTRTTKLVELTPVGEQCVHYAEDAVKAIERIYGTAEEDKRKKTGVLRVGVLFVYPDSNVSDVFELFREAYPQVNAEIYFRSSAELMEHILQKKLDAIVSNIAYELIPPEEQEQLNIDTFVQDSLHLLMSQKHPLAQKTSIAIEEIGHETMFYTDTRSSVKLLLEWNMNKKGYPIPEAQLCPSMTMLFNFVEAGMGVSVISRHVAEGYMRPGLVCVPLDLEMRTYTALITRKAKEKENYASVFREFFLEHIR